MAKIQKSSSGALNAKNRPSSRQRQFEVLVLATMSAGKSSVVNALIGHELLHTANEATTACVTSVAHRRGQTPLHAACYSSSGALLGSETPASAATLRAWNAWPEVQRIEVQGSFSGQPKPSPGLVLHDTPGPNNSQDERHAQMMLSAMRRGGYQAICYVLNASQLGTHDDRALLEQLHQAFPPGSVPVYFILNKVDLLDPEQGESLADCIGKTRRYLMAIGFELPVIVPTMASLALSAQLAWLGQPLTRAQRLRLRQAIEALDVPTDCLLQASEIPSAVKARLLKALNRLRQPPLAALDEAAQERLALQRLQAICGVQTVQALLQYQRQSTQSQ